MYGKGIKLNKYQIHRVKDCMRISKVNQSKLAELLKKTQPQISKILNGSRSLTKDDLNALSEIFNVSTDYLLIKSDTKRDILDSSLKGIKEDPDYIKEQLLDEGLHPLFMNYLDYIYGFTFHVIKAYGNDETLYKYKWENIKMYDIDGACIIKDSDIEFEGWIIGVAFKEMPANIIPFAKFHIILANQHYDLLSEIDKLSRPYNNIDEYIANETKLRKSMSNKSEDGFINIPDDLNEDLPFD